VTITPTGGFNSPTTLSVSGLPSGATETFSPNNAVMTSSTLSVTTTSGTTPGSYPLSITGTSGALTHTTSVTLTVTAPPLADFSLSASPSSQMISRHGASVTYGVTISPSNGFTGTVTLSVSGLPSRANAGFSPNPATTSSTLTVSTSNGTTAGSYTLVITGVSGGLTHTTTVTLVVT
jgi:serine protease AprX